MQSNNLALKVGLLIVASSWLVFTLFQFVSGLSNFSGSMVWYIALTEILGSVGLGFRSAASFIAVAGVSSYFFLSQTLTFLPKAHQFDHFADNDMTKAWD